MSEAKPHSSEVSATPEGRASSSEDRTSSRARRIVAIVLPELLCELARSERASTAHPKREPPLGVTLAEKQESSSLLAAVNESARHFGVCAGQSIAEAKTFVAKLKVHTVPWATVRAALGRVAELSLGFGSPVSLDAPFMDPSKPPDTVWVDITGSAHLAGGEEALLGTLEERVQALGHTVQLAVAEGPILAQAFARWGADSLEQLPLVAFPMASETVEWLATLGVLTVSDFNQLPGAGTTARLGEQGARLIDWCQGRDQAPLIPYEPPRILVEETSWEEPLEGSEPLLFVLRGLTARMSARLLGRGEAAEKLVLHIVHDAAIARNRGVPLVLRLEFELAAALWREAELFRVVSRRLERIQLEAPVLGMRLEVPAITMQKARQLELSRVQGGLFSHLKGVETLPVLLAELSMDLGKECVGVLEVKASHRPEARSVLKAVPEFSNTPKRARRRSAGKAVSSALEHGKSAPRVPTRLLPAPLRLETEFNVGSPLSFDCELFSVRSMRFEHRITRVEWWTKNPVTRDYFRVWLEGQSGGVEAWIYFEPHTGQHYLHAITD